MLATLPSVRRWLRSFSARTLLAITVMIGLTTVACSQDESAGTPLDQVAPTRQDIADQAQIGFPESTQNFRLVRSAPNQIDVNFDISPDDVDIFAADSGFELTNEERTLVHASPLWDVAVTDPLRGGVSRIEGIERSVEVVDLGTIANVRLSLVVSEQSP